MEYARNAVRMASLMKQRAIYVFTHDSVGLGEDGPTHQPVEQLAAMRSTPNLDTWRPCDAVESAIAWQQAILRTDGPSALVFSRQTLPHQEGSARRVSDVGRRLPFGFVEVPAPRVVGDHLPMLAQLQRACRVAHRPVELQGGTAAKQSFWTRLRWAAQLRTLLNAPTREAN